MLKRCSTVNIIAELLLFSTSLSLASPPSSRIVGGVLVEPGEFPYVVSLQLNDQHICGGLIYNDRFVLTAASCVQNFVDVSDLFVNVADLNFLDDEEIDQEAYSVLDIVIAPDNDGSPGQDDLAVIHLTRPLTFGPNVNCVKVGEVEPTGSPKGVIIGYGSQASGGLPSNRCRKGDVTMTGSCPTNNWPNYSESYMICAGTANDVNKPCDFDYGSPLIQDGIAVGILSQQNNCQSSPYDSSIYTRLASYYYWIREEANTQPSNCFSATMTTSSTVATQTTTTMKTTASSTVSVPIITTPSSNTLSSTTVTAPITTLSSNTPSPTTATATTSRITTLGKTTTILSGFVCPGIGQYPFPDDCTKYYLCWTGGFLVASCPAGQIFNPETTFCDDPANVPGGCDTL